MFTLSSLCILLAGCDFDEINTNADRPATATPGMLAAQQIGNMLIKENNGKGFFYDHMISKHISFGEGLAENNQYNYFGRAGFGAYTSLTNAAKMVEIASANKEAYTGLFLFIKAQRLFELSMYLGDIPYSGALKALDGVTSPKYDAQKDVMRQILDDLDAAYEAFETANNFEGDITHFGGDVKKWQRAVSMLQLKVLINLSKKESDADLNIKNRFANIVASRQLLLSNDDNLQTTYGTQASNQYPMYVLGGNRNAMYVDMTTTVMNPMKQYEDYRLFSLAEPCKAEADKGTPAGSWDAYGCVDPSLKYTEEIMPLRGAGKVSLLNNRFFEIQQGQPAIKHGYAEQNFILAEACLRGWISGNANDYYKEGIRASMKFVATHTPEKYAHGKPVTDAWIEQFLQRTDIQLSGNTLTDDNLKKIITQKYLDAFMHDTYNSYFEYRRTGFPELPVNPESNRNTVTDKIPVRWMYASDEYQYNRDNVLEAVQRQFGGNDDVNELMWILK
jgi:hypothetical protein